MLPTISFHKTLAVRLLLALLLLVARGACPAAAGSHCCERVAEERVAMETRCDDGCSEACEADAGSSEKKNADHDRAHGELPCSQGCAWCSSLITAVAPRAPAIVLFPTSFAAPLVPRLTAPHAEPIDHPPC